MLIRSFIVFERYFERFFLEEFKVLEVKDIINFIRRFSSFDNDKIVSIRSYTLLLSSNFEVFSIFNRKVLSSIFFISLTNSRISNSSLLDFEFIVDDI